MNTYYNDFLEINYPFSLDQELPHGLRNIQAISVCVSSKDVMNAFVTDATCNGGTTTVNIAYRQTGSSVPASLCSLACTDTGSVFYGQSSFAESGFMSAKNSDAYEYHGEFTLDRTCMEYMTDVTSKISVDGRAVTVPNSFTISFEGALTIDGSQRMVCDPSHLYDGYIKTDSSQAPRMVTAINNTECLGVSGSTLAIVSADTSRVLLDMTTCGSVIEVLVTGTTSFTNCYNSDDDAPSGGTNAAV